MGRGVDEDLGWVGERLAEYTTWLSKQPLAEHTRRAYRTRVAQFLEWLAGYGGEAGDPLADPHARDYAMRDYKRHLKGQRKLAASTVNLTLAAVDHFYRHLGLEAAGVAP